MSLFSRFVRFLIAFSLVLPLGLAVPVFDAEARKFRGFGSSKKWSSSSKKTKKKDGDDADADGDTGGSWGRVRIPGWRSDDDDDGARVANKSPEDELSPAPDDYYTKRAKALLAADKAVHDAKPHPLAKGFPDMFVVVCEAGCPNRTEGQIVDMVPRPKKAVKVEYTMVPMASSTGEAKSAALQDGVQCMAGCYNGMKKSYTGRAAAAAGAVAGYEDTWMTTVSDNEADAPVSPETKSESGSWLTAREGDTAVAAAAETTTAFAADEPSPAAAAPAPKKITAVTPSEDAAGAKTAPVEASPAVSPANSGARAGANSESQTKTAAEASKAVRAPAAAESPPVVVKAEEVTPAATPVKAAPPMTVVNAGAAAASDSQDTANPSQRSQSAEVGTETKNAPKAPGRTSTPAPAAKAADKPSIADAAKTVAPARNDVRQKDGAEKEQQVAAVQDKPATPATTITPKRPDQPVLVSSKDPEMNAAIRKARANLDGFWAKLASPAVGETDFSVKVAIKDGKNIEHFWIIGVKRAGDKISGTINNEPELVKNVAFGEHYEFTDEVISDWLYRRNGKMVGNETMRPLLKRMPEDVAAPYWAMYEKP